jgi:hypothetical protein
MDKIDLKKGAPVLKLNLSNGEVYSGEAAAQFKTATPFAFLAAKVSKESYFRYTYRLEKGSKG